MVNMVLTFAILLYLRFIPPTDLVSSFVIRLETPHRVL